jgi:hypothetical protein
MKTLLIIFAFISMVSCEWRQGEYKLEITIEHQMIPEKDTILARHYHKVNNGFYVITIDSLELWVDNLKEIMK